jgi:murein DD-endopeptidase MepM/ murein hydrolase activator NlpD
MTPGDTALGATLSAGGEDIASRLERSAARGDRAGLREAARQFEGYLVQSMIKEMRKATSSGEGLFGGSAMSTWNDMFDQEIAARIVEGRGLGLAENLVEGIQARYPTRGADVADILGAGRSGWMWPLPADAPGRLTSEFGDRADPLHGAKARHHGLDVAAAEGTAVLAMAAGRVVHAGVLPGYGNVVDLDHGNGIVTRYAHQATLSVRVGDRLGAGDRLGEVGSTGRSTGPHLHVEVRVDGTPVDPLRWLRGDESR